MGVNFSSRHLSSGVSEEPMKIADGFLVEGVSERRNGGGVFSQPWCSSIEKGGYFGSGRSTGGVFSESWCSSIEKGDCFDYGRSTGDLFSQPWCSGIEKGDCFDYGRSTGDVFSQPWCSGIEKGDFFDYGRSTGDLFSHPWCSGLEKGDCFDYGRDTGDVFSHPWCLGNEKGDCFGSGRSTGDVFSHPWCSGIEKGDCFGSGRSTGDSDSVDVLDVLPSDPFGMDMNNTFTAITGWLEDLEVDYSGLGREEIGFGISDGDHQQLVAGLSFIWNNAMRFQEFPESRVYNGSLYRFEEGVDGEGSCPGTFKSPTSVDEVGESSERCNNDGGESANIHPAFEFCLYHLGVKDLLSVSMVCKSLHTTVCDDSLLWKHIHISHPLNEKITDEALLQLTERAHGTMQCLRLVDCWKITEDGLRKVLERNPQVVKLGVPGCLRISIDGLVSILRDLKFAGKLQVKHLETGGPYGVTQDHYDELLDLLDIDNNVEQSIQKPPRYYHKGYACASCDDVQSLDIEMCRKCERWEIVYDCPAEECKGKEECRACSLCVMRCSKCGRCIIGSVYEETFCLENLCSGCSKLHNSPLV